MPVIPLTNGQGDQLVLHIDELYTIGGSSELGSAAGVANKAVGYYETLAANLPGGLTGFDCGIQEGETLAVPERAALVGRINAMTAVITGDEVAADIANECLELFEERFLGLIGATTGRDVTQEQLPR